MNPVEEKSNLALLIYLRVIDILNGLYLKPSLTAACPVVHINLRYRSLQVSTSLNSRIISFLLTAMIELKKLIAQMSSLYLQPMHTYSTLHIQDCQPHEYYKSSEFLSTQSCLGLWRFFTEHTVLVTQTDRKSWNCTVSEIHWEQDSSECSFTNTVEKKRNNM